MHKTCNVCYERKSITDFYRQSSAKDGHQNRCKSCANSDVTKRLTSKKNRKYLIASKYGISEKEYDLLLAKQNNKCAICSSEFTSTPCVDHDHEHGYSRGLLCSNCNLGLGHFKDSISSLEKAITYLKEYEI